jgi:chromate transporter
VGWLLLPIPPPDAHVRSPSADADADAGAHLSRAGGVAALLIFALLLIGLPAAAAMTADHTLALVDRFFRTGSLVFGGGHVVLPLLQAQVVPPGWISNESFLAGYAAAQAVPGPLFSFAGYLGAAMAPPPHGWLGATICLVAIFLPSFLLVFGVMPFWATLRQRPAMRSALQGVNAAVVGILLSALYNPVFTSAIRSASDLAIALTGFLLLVVWKLPSWAVLLFCTGAASAIAAVG